MAYTASAGSKVEYCSTSTGTFERLMGLLSIPAIGEEPNKISTTTLDNTTYETEINGLMPAPKLSFEFNMEDPSATSNIKKVADLATSGDSYYWKVTLSNGIVHSFQSKVKYGFKEVGVDEIAGFTMFLAPEAEITTTIPTASL